MALKYEIYRKSAKGEVPIREYQGSRPASHVMRQLDTMAENVLGDAEYVNDGLYGHWENKYGESLEMRLVFA